MSKTNLILLGIAVVQLVLVLFVGGDDGRRAASASVTLGDPIFAAALDSASIGRIEVTDDDGKTVEVQRVPGPEGKPDTFGLASKDGFPVRESEVTSLVGTLNKMRRGRVVTTKPKSFTNLQVANERFARHVVLKDKSGGTLADFYLGEGQKSDQLLYRKAGEEVAYLASGASSFEFSTGTSAWVETTFTDFPFDEVVKVKLERESGAIEFEREDRPKPGAAPKEGEKPKEGEAPKDGDTPKEGDKPKEGEAPKDGEKPKDSEKPAEAPKPETEPVWVLRSPEGPKDLDKAKVDTLVRGLCRLYLAEPAGKGEKEEYGFGKPTATATLTLKDGAVRTIKVGAKREKENDYFAQRTGFAFVATLRSYSIDDYFLKKLDDLFPPKPGEEKKPEDHDDHEGHDHK